jgi:general bacterial porin, GBP family
VFKLASVGDIREWVLGGRFEFGKTTLWLQYLDDRTRLANQSHGGMVGLTYADGPWQYRATLSKSVQENIAGSKIGATTKAGAGTTYSFSRRTSLYANVAFTRNRHGATALPQGGIGQTAPDRGGHGREIGLRTSF